MARMLTALEATLIGSAGHKHGVSLLKSLGSVLHPITNAHYYDGLWRSRENPPPECDGWAGLGDQCVSGGNDFRERTLPTSQPRTWLLLSL
ncbi:hypothetical protein LY78DRAFT_403765 [Colletotrichum sublineola]|nr:hypothetical protein LY78DRAFT_403765 [Colletotrichum sublineola]